MNTTDATLEQVEEALGHFVASAKALGRRRTVGNSQWVSPWDVLHATINELLDRWEALKLEEMASL